MDPKKTKEFIKTENRLVAARGGGLVGEMGEGGRKVQTSSGDVMYRVVIMVNNTVSYI